MTPRIQTQSDKAHPILVADGTHNALDRELDAVSATMASVCLSLAIIDPQSQQQDHTEPLA
eukprot:CAMPEP_0177502420 /NCGR_PEP_ID=MMETSP0369-20130122/37765_1 /TAXON_ID=447022 ORGANISM="Scrippsiella hangoei-like, Strain SHHI-4" /NCGR_SAMPLE_ID=MMETSP0369 /ASSEMBLY_ACC=CAM_ASM_000364 /LENGTH=60 /DNA_ID=CAMNT_0018980025 /DNA_START=168 /DNA_END=350 /DNA_ORIENTATION=-